VDSRLRGKDGLGRGMTVLCPPIQSTSGLDSPSRGNDAMRDMIPIQHLREGTETLPYDNGLARQMTVVVPPSNPLTDWIPP